MERRKFLTGLVSAIPTISTIKYGETAGVLDMVTTHDKFRELLIRSSAVKQAFLSDDKRSCISASHELLQHINNEFDHNSPMIELKIGQSVIFNKNGVDETALENLSECWHPIAAFRELLRTNGICLYKETIQSGQWKLFSKNYNRLIVG